MTIGYPWQSFVRSGEVLLNTLLCCHDSPLTQQTVDLWKTLITVCLWLRAPTPPTTGNTNSRRSDPDLPRSGPLQHRNTGLGLHWWCHLSCGRRLPWCTQYPAQVWQSGGFCRWKDFYPELYGCSTDQGYGWDRVYLYKPAWLVAIVTVKQHWHSMWFVSKR